MCRNHSGMCSRAGSANATNERKVIKACPKHKENIAILAQGCLETSRCDLFHTSRVFLGLARGGVEPMGFVFLVFVVTRHLINQVHNLVAQITHPAGF